MRTSLLFSTLALAFASASAQGLSNLPDLGTNLPGASLTGTGKTTGATGKATTTGKQGATSATGDAKTTSTGHTAGAITNAPSLSTSAAAGGLHLSNLPTLSGITIPSLIVPNTAGAPFMQQSSLPEGTIFICVGAILGFLGACVLAWRGMIAWSLHRSVKRAAAAQYLSDKKIRYPASGAYSTQNVSMENLTSTLNNSSYSYGGSGGGGGGGGMAKGSGKKGGRQFTPNSSLFFSPTAGAGIHANSGRDSFNNNNNATTTSMRTSSTYLPAGYYASGASLPAAGAAMAHLGVGPQGAGYGRLSSQPNLAVTASPPDSPRQYPSDRPGDRFSTYSQTQSMAPSHSRSGSRTQQRTPSNYLDELFENHGNGPRERY